MQRGSLIPHCSLVFFLLTPFSPLWGREVTVIILCFSRLSYLFLKSTSLLLKSRCSEIIDDIHHSPVCRIGWSPILHGTTKHKSRQQSWQSKQVYAARLTTQSPRGRPGPAPWDHGPLFPQRPRFRFSPRTVIILVFLRFRRSRLSLAQSLFS